MKQQTNTERGRITIRVCLSIQEKLQEAATLTGTSLSQFMIQSALEKAEQLIDRESSIKLTREDAVMLCTLLDNKADANDIL